MPAKNIQQGTVLIRYQRSQSEFFRRHAQSSQAVSKSFFFAVREGHFILPVSSWYLERIAVQFFFLTLTCLLAVSFHAFLFSTPSARPSPPPKSEEGNCSERVSLPRAFPTLQCDRTLYPPPIQQLHQQPWVKVSR